MGYLDSRVERAYASGDQRSSRMECGVHYRLRCAHSHSPVFVMRTAQIVLIYSAHIANSLNALLGIFALLTLEYIS